MKFSTYLDYTSRSLLRGGQRTLLAIFCVAVGVTAVVSLQLVGLMLHNTLTADVRDSNGGDIAVTSFGTPFKQSDLAFFSQLKANGTITNDTAVIAASGTLSATASSAQAFTVVAVDSNNYPLVSPPAFVTPGNGSVAHLLLDNQVIVTQSFLDRYQLKPGTAFTVYMKTNTGVGQALTVQIAGVIANTGTFAQAGNLLLISTHDYLAAAPPSLNGYSTVYITTADQAHTAAAIKSINAQFPLVATQSAADVLKSEQSSVDTINKFLEVAGLLALLIGGVGVVNTMQVLLARRKTEIAVLKTAGYHRRNLYALFGLEAGLLGLIGGIIGAGASIGVSYLIRNLMQSLGDNLLFQLNLWIILRGIALGCVTALIFGLIPMVRAANVRPLHVLRNQDGTIKGGFIAGLLLLAVFSLLFCAMAIVIFNNNVVLGVEATYGTFAFLLLLGAFLALIVFAVSKLPVPERFQFNQLATVLAGVALSLLLYEVQPVLGICLLAVSLLGLCIGFLPHSWKMNIKMALRNIGRQRTRVLTTLLALFIGVFGIGTVIGVGHDAQAQINNALAQNQPYNVIATTSSKNDQQTLLTQLSSMPGLSSSREDSFIAALPTAINGQASQQVLPTGSGRQQVLTALSGIEGYNLSQHVPALTIVQGRNLNASDANTNNVLVSEAMTRTGWFNMNLKVGDTITFSSANGQAQRTVTVVGITSKLATYEDLGQVLASASLVQALSPVTGSTTTVFYMKVAPAQVNHALDWLSQVVPDATVQHPSDAAVAFLQQLNSIMDVQTAIALLSVIAAIIIIANTVALAMLERKRELGILKSVGYTSSTLLSEVLIECGIIGGIGAFIAILLANSGVAVLGSLFFNLSLNMDTPVVVSLLIGTVLLAMLTAALVAWQPVRIRPLEVLRYE